MNNIGYKADQRCDVCHVVNECHVDPRFGYFVCINRRNMSPIDVSQVKEQHLNDDEAQQ